MGIDEQERAASPLTLVLFVCLPVLLVAWFLYGWLVQRQGLVNSIGESAGTGFATLLIVSIVGSIRRGRG
jgi:hypothetical protein